MKAAVARIAGRCTRKLPLCQPNTYIILVYTEFGIFIGEDEEEEEIEEEGKKYIEDKKFGKKKRDTRKRKMISLAGRIFSYRGTAFSMFQRRAAPRPLLSRI